MGSWTCGPDMGTVFVYGTLMYPEVLEALIQRVPDIQPGTVNGYARYAVRGQVFPGAIAVEGECMVRATRGEGFPPCT